jgi:long-chain acyl-CoA synthetase
MAQNARRFADQGHNFRLHPKLQIISGGSYLEAEIATAIKATLGINVYQGYGLTETLPINGTYPGKDKPGSLGMPFSDEVQLAIVDSQGQEVRDGMAGEIAIRSRTLLEGYRGKPVETGQFLRDGWFYTGDLGFKDSEGFLHFVARRCGITKVASQMADLVEVEEAIRTIPAIADVRVTVTVRPEIGESLAASIILRDGAKLNERQVKVLCKKLLSPHKTPREFRIYESAGGMQ